MTKKKVSEIFENAIADKNKSFRLRAKSLFYFDCFNNPRKYLKETTEEIISEKKKVIKHFQDLFYNRGKGSNLYAFELINNSEQLMRLTNKMDWSKWFGEKDFEDERKKCGLVETNFGFEMCDAFWNWNDILKKNKIGDKE